MTAWRRAPAGSGEKASDRSRQLRSPKLESSGESPAPLDSAPLDRRVATGLHKLGLALKHQTWSPASEHGLSPTQGQMPAVLAADGVLSTSEVAARLGIGLPTVSEAVTTLATKRLVRRTPDRRHPRARLLRLTAAGARLSARTRAWPEFLTQAVGSLGDAEQARSSRH